MTRVLLATAALGAAVVVWIASALPPARLVLDTSWSDASVPGLLHVHTNRSDGRSGPDDIAAAAARAGLKFIVFTDHGDATREADPPTYRAGVLCLDGVEISTSGGHYVAIGLPRAPYPLAGEARDVVEDVARLGGFGIAAHPDSPKSELRWNDWDLPIDGLELINPDTSWRVRLASSQWGARFALLSALLTYPIRPSETIGHLLTASPELQARWRTLTAVRPVVGLAGADAHAKIQLRDVDPGDNRYSLPLPGYEASFRALSVHVFPPSPMTGNAETDAQSILGAIRNGRLYTAVDAWASPPAFDFTALNPSGTAQAGEWLASGGAGSLHVKSNAPDGSVSTVWRGSDVMTTSRDREFSVPIDGQAAAYQVEIRTPNRPEGPSWVISNPIYVGMKRVPGVAAPRPAPAGQLSLFDGRSTAGWTTESDRTSVVALDEVPMVTGGELRLRYGLAGGSSVGQFSGAAVETTNGVADYTRVAFTIRAEHPMRVSVQARAESPGADSERWQRSIVLDARDAELSVAFADMSPIGTTRTARPALDAVRALMFIVDTTNSKPGASGRIWIRNVRLER